MANHLQRLKKSPIKTSIKEKLKYCPRTRHSLMSIELSQPSAEVNLCNKAAVHWPLVVRFSKLIKRRIILASLTLWPRDHLLQGCDSHSYAQLPKTQHMDTLGSLNNYRKYEAIEKHWPLSLIIHTEVAPDIFVMDTETSTEAIYGKQGKPCDRAKTFTRAFALL